MAITDNIPLTTLTTSQSFTSPGRAVGSFTAWQLSVNRNVGATPLDSLSGDVIELHVDYSADGGTTWPVSDSDTVTGGAVFRHGTQQEVSTFGSSFVTSIGGAPVTHIRGRVHAVQGCTVSGSLTLSP